MLKLLNNHTQVNCCYICWQQLHNWIISIWYLRVTVRYFSLHYITLQ